MKAKDLTQADVGKWVTLRGEIAGFHEDVVEIYIHGELDSGGKRFYTTFNFDADVEFTTPPQPVQEVGDVFKMVKNGQCEWIISAIVGNACLLTTGGTIDPFAAHQSWDYPIEPEHWEFVRKGTVA